MSLVGRETLVAPDDTWSLLMVMCVAVAISIYLEQKYMWASKISGAIIALLFALVLSNLSIIPTACTLYDDIIWGFAVPMGIPLLMLQCNMKKIWKETGRIMIIFCIGSAGTVAGAFLAYALLHNFIPGLAGVAAIMTGSYIGGGVNFAALATEFNVGEIKAAATVADNLLMALYFFALIFIAGMKFFQKHIAMNVAYCVVVVFLAKLIASGISAVIPTTNTLLSILNTFFGSQYVWITTIAMFAATVGEKQVENLSGSQEIGTYFIYLFLFVIGIMVLTNMLFCFVFGKLLHFDLEDIILASNANIGGPTTAAGMAISQGWTKLVGPVMLIGTFGYVIGTYLGVVVGGLLGA